MELQDSHLEPRLAAAHKHESTALEEPDAELSRDMLFPEEDAPLLKAWIVKRIENTCVCHENPAVERCFVY